MKNYRTPEVKLISMMATDVLTVSGEDGGEDELPDQEVED